MSRDRSRRLRCKSKHPALIAGFGAYARRTCCGISAEQESVSTIACLYLGVFVQSQSSTRVRYRRFFTQATRWKDLLPTPQPWTSIPTNANNGPALFGDLVSARSAQSHLYDRLQEKLRSDPGESPAQMLEWYQERLKESRSRLLQGSADSYHSNLLLINYAAQQHDIRTLRRLKPAAQIWSQRWKHEMGSSETRANLGGTALLSEKIDGILFVLAAKQGNWQVMLKLATSRHPRKRWTPQMCLAMLRSRGALDMITRIQHHLTPSKLGSSDNDNDDTPEHNDVVAKQILWSMFLREFWQYWQKPKLTSSNISEPLPSWITAALLDLYSKSGKVGPTLDLAWSYIQLHENKGRSSNRSQARILRNGPSRLLTSPNSLIPGPRILYYILKAVKLQEDSNAVLQAFAALTHTDLRPQGELNLAHPLFRQNKYIFEPDNNIILLVMDAMVKAETHSKDLPDKLLSFLRSVDRSWGSWRARMDPSWHPMFLDLRPIQRLLDLCLEMDAYRIVRQVLRFQQGLFRRELKWHTTPHKKRLWRQGLNELTMLREWTDTLAALRRRRWIIDDQAQSLYHMASQLAQLYRYCQPVRRSSRQFRRKQLE